MLSRMLFPIAMLAATGCATVHHETNEPLRVPYLSVPIAADGKLDEACYSEHPPLIAFTVAGEPAREAASTKAWLFWNEDQLVCAFTCADTTPAAAPPGAGERDVDGQDRCELFLWNGNAEGAYYCVEAAPLGALHDYEARFYRKFNDAWSPVGGWAWQAQVTSTGYTIEMVLPKAAIGAMGLRLKAGVDFRAGLFRADYDKYSGTPDWITWIDYGGNPDFHIAESFGTVTLTQ